MLRGVWSRGGGARPREVLRRKVIARGRTTGTVAWGKVGWGKAGPGMCAAPPSSPCSSCSRSDWFGCLGTVRDAARKARAAGCGLRGGHTTEAGAGLGRRMTDGCGRRSLHAFVTLGVLACSAYSLCDWRCGAQHGMPRKAIIRRRAERRRAERREGTGDEAVRAFFFVVRIPRRTSRLRVRSMCGMPRSSVEPAPSSRTSLPSGSTPHGAQNSAPSFPQALRDLHVPPSIVSTPASYYGGTDN
jgi:hypothetical protein